jgi:hypothetical protein
MFLRLVGCVFIYIYLRTRSKNYPPLPPGPPVDPIIGHLRLVPPDNQDTLFYKWGKNYGQLPFLENMRVPVLIMIIGGVMHLKFLGQSAIVLNSVQASVDLLEKRGANYGDRPPFILYNMFAHHIQPVDSD